MKNLLIKLMVRLTKSDRYRPDFEWSKSWVYNLFRVYEQIFGKRYGPQRETLLGWNEYEDVYQFFTLEAFLCYLEGEVRAWFALPKWNFQKVEIWTPIFASVEQTARLPMQIPYLFAIARDTSASATLSNQATGSTFKAFTVTGSNPFLVNSFRDNGDNTDAITSEAYNGMSLTQLHKADLSAAVFAYTYYLLNPSTGTNNLALNFSNGPRSYVGFVASYSGVSSGGLDATSLFTDTSCATNTHAVTPVAANCWAVVGEVNVDGNPVAGTGATVFGTPANTSGFFDSNGTVTAGAAYSMTITVSGGTRNGLWSMFTIKPPSVANGNFFRFM